MAHPMGLDKGSVSGRAAFEGRIVQVEDVLVDPQYTKLKTQKLGGFRTALGVPLMREGNPIGCIFLTRAKVEPFNGKQIELLTTFADQAVIAIENVRLFDEVQARTEDLRDSLQQQTATADVLKVISRSTFDLQPVLDTLVSSACRLCEADIATVRYQDGSSLPSCCGLWSPLLSGAIILLVNRPNRIVARSLGERLSTVAPSISRMCLPIPIYPPGGAKTGGLPGGARRSSDTRRSGFWCIKSASLCATRPLPRNKSSWSRPSPTRP